MSPEMLLAIIALLGLANLGGLAVIHRQIGRLEGDQAAARRDITRVSGRLDNLEAKI